MCTRAFIMSNQNASFKDQLCMNIATAHNGMDCEMKTYTDAEYIKSEFISAGSDDETEGCYALLLYVWSKVQS